MVIFEGYVCVRCDQSDPYMKSSVTCFIAQTYTQESSRIDSLHLDKTR